MGNLEVILVMAIIAIFILLVVLFIIPDSDNVSKKKKKKKKKKSDIKIDQDSELIKKQFLAKIEKLEHVVEGLRKKNEGHETQSQKKDKELIIEKAKCEKLQEKIKQERGWQEKERAGYSRKEKELVELKKEIKKVQQEFTESHATNLRISKEAKEIKGRFDSITEEKRLLEAENLSLNNKLQGIRQEMARTKRDYLEIKKKHEDTSWIAKSEYVKLEQEVKKKEKLLVEAQKELDRFKRSVEKEIK